MRYFSCLLLFIFFLNKANAQSYSFVNYSIAEGLAQTQVKAICEDVNGYLWIGTLGGLSRFNGSKFQNFSTDDGLFNNRITSLSCIKDELWIGHQGGVTLLKNKSFFTWSFGEKNKNVSVSKILKFKDKIVIATNGKGIYIIEKNKISALPLESDDENRIRGMVVFKGNLFFASRAGLIKTSDLKLFSNLHQNNNLTSIAIQENLLYATTVDGKVILFSNEKVKDSLLIKEDLFLNSSFIDSKGKIWIASNNGIHQLENGNLKHINSNVGLPFNPTNIVYEDRNGTIWIGSDGSGLFRFTGSTIVHYNKNNGALSELVTSSIQLDQKTLLFGTYDEGLMQFKNNTFEAYSNKKSIIWATIKDSKNNIWIASEYGLSKHNDKQKGAIQEYDELNEIKYTCFYRFNKNKIYVGGSNGIALIENGSLTKIPSDFNKNEVGTIRNIVYHNNKLICATDFGLFEFKNGKFIRFLNLKLTSYSLKVDSENKLWIGTEDGLFYSDGQKVKKISLSDQPASNFINFINSNGKFVFVGTNNGLYALSSLGSNGKYRIQHFGIEEGVVNLETNINSSLITKSGFLWFGTASGLSKFDLKSLEKEHFVQSFLNIKLNFQDFDYEEFTSELQENGLPKRLSLPYNKNNLIIELDGVQLKNYSELKYEYWLEGLDSTWLPSFSTPTISLSNLPSGNFTLHVRTKNAYGHFSNEFILELKISPVYYKTWWFISIFIILISSIIYASFKFQINREKAKRYKESLEFKTKLISLEQQSLNASMNRHFIFNSLNSIQYFINTQDKYSANKYLTDFAKLIRKNLDASAENNQVSLKLEIERLDLYLSLESMRFKDKFDYKIIYEDVDLDEIKVPAMLFQPFVENSIIHGVLPNTEKKGLITITVKDLDSKIWIIIEDNGIGIENSLMKKHETMGDHKSQGMEITAKRISLLNKLTEEDYELEGPYQIENEDRLISGTRVLIKIPYKNLVD